MSIETYITQLILNPEVVAAQLRHVTDEQARWKPSPDDWSLLETINHLYDEERRDFRVRIDYVLHKPDQPWPPIDPPQWVVDERYNERDLAESLANYQAERKQSLTWLAELGDVDWTTTAQAPWGEPIQAGDLLAAWAAHDLLHIRQINELHYRYLQKTTNAYSPEYAGQW